VQAHWRRDSCVGLAEDVDELGNLQLRLEDGRLVTLSAGDVTLRGPEP
jgi:biotin-(acetyl-CoA carboxylase) ligase